MSITLWRPLNQVTRRDRALDFGRDFDDFFGDIFPVRVSEAEGSLWAPAIDLRETKDAITLEAEVPGLETKDINVSVLDDVLTIRGEKRREKEVEEEDYYRAERTYGAFERSVTMPSSVDPEKVKATVKNGVLHVTLPKREEVKPKEVRIETE